MTGIVDVTTEARQVVTLGKIAPFTYINTHLAAHTHTRGDAVLHLTKHNYLTFKEQVCRLDTRWK